MKMKFLALILCLAQLLSCGLMTGCSRAQDDFPAEEAAFDVIYIPLDNRPINDQQVRMLASSLRINLLMPEEGVYSTKLNGAVNDAGLQYGDRAAILEWLMENEDESDVIIVYLDQMLSGGLMNSRCMEQMQPATLSDGSVFSEYEIIDYIASLAETHTVYAIDSQLRLALSSGYLDFTAEDYSISRKYGLVERPAFDETTSGIEDVIAGYTLSANGSEALYEADLTQEQIDYYLSGGDDSPLNRYLSIRERKLQLNAYAIETLYPLENVRYFFGVDDSATGNNIQSAEFAYLNALAGGDLEKLSAIDCLGELAVSCAFRDYCGNDSVTVAVKFYGSEESTLNFAGHTITEAIDQIIDYCGAVSVSESADIEILVACNSATEDETQAASDALVARMKENSKNQQPTIYVDFASKTNNDILAQTDISMLLAAGLHANGSGASAIMGISQGLARYRALQREDYLTTACHEVFIENLVFMFAKGYYWNSGYKYEMGSYLAELGLDANNMTNATQEQLERINTTLTNKIIACSAGILESVNGGTYISSLNPYKESTVKSVSISDCSYPWMRTFEFTAEFSATLK